MSACVQLRSLAGSHQSTRTGGGKIPGEQPIDQGLFAAKMGWRWIAADEIGAEWPTCRVTELAGTPARLMSRSDSGMTNPRLCSCSGRVIFVLSVLKTCRRSPPCGINLGFSQR